MSARPRIPLVLALAAAVLAGASAAHAQFTYDTLYTTNSRCAPPAMVAGPDGVLHLIVPEETAFRHFWRQGGPWQQEQITPTTPVVTANGTSYIDVAVGSANRLAVLRRGLAGELIVLRPGAGTYWDPDTIPGTSALNLRTTPALELHPATDEPVVAFTVRSPGIPRLMLAQRHPAGWTIAQVDTSVEGIGEPALVLDPEGRIHLAVNNDGGPEGYGVYHVEADSVPGPFTWTRADTFSAGVAAITSRPAIALDPVTGDPRIVHAFSFWPGYASRSGGVWTSAGLYSDFSPAFYGTPPSLVLDGARRPWIFASGAIPVLSTSSSAVDPACGLLNTYIPHLFTRDQATGTGAFSWSAIPNHGSDESGPQSLVWHDGRIHVVWLDSVSFSCWPSGIVYGVSAPVASVPHQGLPVSTLRVAPNPIRSGGSLQLRLHAVEGTVAIDVTDISGRRVVRTEHTGASGEREIRWSLPSLRAGWYRVTARQGSVRIGSASFLVIR